MNSHHSGNADFTVWVVDDDDIQLQVVEDMLTQLEVKNIQLVNSGRQAIHQLQQASHHPALVIVDLYMPDIDGIELVSQLAKMQFSGGLIIVSGVNSEMLAMAGMLAQENGLKVLAAWEKPMSMQALAAAIKSQR